MEEMNVCPKTYMVQSVLVTLFCCLLFGILGIINASKVSKLYAAGDIEGAKAASKKAKNFCIWGAVLAAPLSVLAYLAQSSH